MSDRNLARRAAVQVAFEGVDITSDIRPYLSSLTYTDNEDDQADDLQIKLHDRDSIWLTKWLNDAINAASETSSETVTETTSGASSETSVTSSYKVTARSGLNVRSGPGTSYGKYGALVCGSTVEVSSIENGWAAIAYNGKTAYVYATYIEQISGGSTSVETSGSSATKASSSGNTGFKIQATIARQNWKGDGNDKILECGQFELDTVEVSGPPSIVTLKSTSLPFSTQIRQTKKSKAWENIRLSGIVSKMAAAGGMAFLFLSSNDPFYERVEQRDESDIAFLSALCHNAGISLKATNNILVLFDQVDYESKDAILTIVKGSKDYIKYKHNIGTADTKYASCRVSYVDSNGRCIEATAKIEDYKEDSEDNQQLEITAKVSSAAEAMALAEKMLRKHNKYAKTATFTLPGNPDIVAGVTVMLKGWGPWDGKYIVKQAKHIVGGSGYTTQIILRRVLEGY